MGRWILKAFVVLCLAACGGGGGGGPRLQSISVAPANPATIAVAMTVQFTATGNYSNGTSRDLTAQVTWASSMASVGTVNAAGLATGAGGGTTTISATRGSVSGSTVLAVAPPVPGNPTVWNFENAAQPFAASIGTATLQYRDPNATGWGPASTTFSTAGALGLPLLTGGNSGVMAFPATAPDQGYTLTHNAPPNGVFAGNGVLSNYTIVMDVLWPAGSPSPFRGVLQTNPLNGDDGELFIKTMTGGTLGVGINGFYNQYASVATGTWHRIAIAVQCALGSGGTGQIHKYIDGLFVGGHNTPEQSPGATDCRWSLGATLALFTDDDNETSPGYVSSILFVDRFMFAGEIAALGGPHANGANVPGAPAPAPPQVAGRRVLIFAHRTQGTPAPENTLLGLGQAFDLGADHVECDVRATQDGELVLMHDADVDRTTNGTGPVDAIDLADLQLLDAGSWLDPSFSSARVPTLAAALAAADGRGRLLLDVKLVGLGAQIQQALDDAGVTADAIWPSLGTDDVAAADFTTNIPGVGILWGAPPATLDTAAFDDLKAKGVVGFDMDYGLATQAFVDAAHANGLFVIVYTVFDPDTMLSLIDLGVDGMETDFPVVLDSLMPPPLGP